MNKLFKGATAVAVALGTSSYTALAAGINFGKDNLDGNISGTDDTVDVAAQKIIANFSTFLYVIAVAFGLWGGFQILTAGGDDGKVTKGKTILIQAGLGLIVIFLASSVIEFVITKLFA